MPNSIQTISVRTASPYHVTIGSGLLGRCGDLLRPVLPICRVAVITDSTVAPMYLNTVTDSLTAAGYGVCSYCFPAGEANKNFATLSNILEFLAEQQLTRTDCIVALGGGVTGDVAGFAAGVYLRGIRYVQMPTTLLAAVDSSVGGKTAIDLHAGKNLAGVFLQPTAVLCDTDCLATLPPHVFADGAAEAIKTGILCDEALFSLFEQDSPTNIANIIARCVAFKAGVVERDEKEQHERRLLNLGHTIGHAIEKSSNYTISHGHAVAAGLAVIARGAEALGWTDHSTAQRICRCLTKYALPVSSTFSGEALAEAALSDKKRSGDHITVVIPRAVGHCELRTISFTDLLPLIQAGLEG